jgi:hypothetical protein
VSIALWPAQVAHVLTAKPTDFFVEVSKEWKIFPRCILGRIPQLLELLLQIGMIPFKVHRNELSDARQRMLRILDTDGVLS